MCKGVLAAIALGLLGMVLAGCETGGGVYTDRGYYNGDAYPYAYDEYGPYWAYGRGYYFHDRGWYEHHHHEGWDRDGDRHEWREDGRREARTGQTDHAGHVTAGHAVAAPTVPGGASQGPAAAGGRAGGSIGAGGHSGAGGGGHR